jgi:uncharacterized protein
MRMATTLSPDATLFVESPASAPEEPPREPAARPVAGTERISALDFARGVALFGILLMNITAFGLPRAYDDPTVYGGATGADLWSWITTSMLFEGTQRGLFSLLFGAGLVLMTRSLERSAEPHAQDYFFRRNLWLIVFGVVHAYVLLWVGEILYYYGVTALVVYGLRNAKTKTLLGLAVGGLLIAAAWNGLDSYNGFKKHRAYATVEATRVAGDSLTAEQQAAVTAWEGVVKGMKPDSATLQREIAAKRGSYKDVFVHQAPRVARAESWWLYRYFFDVFSLMLLGIVLFRTGVITAKASTRTYGMMILLGYGIGLTVNFFEVSHILRSNFSVLALKEAEITYDLGRLAMTAGHLGVLMLFARSGVLTWLRSSLAAVGRMAFSNYILHSIICAFVFYGFGLGLFGQLRRHELYYVVGAIWLFQLIVSPIWLRHYRFGPLEWLWRWLTYGKRPAMRVSG